MCMLQRPIKSTNPVPSHSEKQQIITHTIVTSTDLTSVTLIYRTQDAVPWSPAAAFTPRTHTYMFDP